MTDVQIREKSLSVLQLLKEAGADEATSTYSESETREFNVDGGKFSLMRTLFDSSISLTMLKDHKRGHVASNQTDEASIKVAVQNCLDATLASEPDDAWKLAPEKHVEVFSEGVFEPDLELYFTRLEELVSDIKRLYPKIMIEQMISSHEKYRSCYSNTSGSVLEKRGGQFGVDLMFSAHEGEHSSSFNYLAFSFQTLDKPFIDYADVKEQLANTEKQIETVPMKGKLEGTVLFAPSCFAEFLGMAIGNFASERAILEGTSLWKDKQGQQVADARLNVRFNPFDKRIVDGDRFTGDGFLSQDATLIENGVLKRFMISYYASNKTGLERFPNDGSALIVDGGEKSFSQILSEIPKGIFVARFSGGEPNSSGEFSGVAKNAFLIEDGKLTKALSETMVSGNLADMLMNLKDLSSEQLEDGGMAVPYAAFEGITITGK